MMKKGLRYVTVKSPTGCLKVSKHEIQKAINRSQRQRRTLIGEMIKKNYVIAPFKSPAGCLKVSKAEIPGSH
jgi:fructose-bisphosphate aldolase class 1